MDVAMTSSEAALVPLPVRAGQVLQELAGAASPDQIGRAKQLVLELRNARQFDLMGRLAEAVSRLAPKDATSRRLYGQYLLDTGKVMAALDVLRPLLRLPSGHDERAEGGGLIGRAHTQLFIEASDQRSAVAVDSLRRAIGAYRRTFESDKARHTWQGVNVLALVARARRLGLRVAAGLEVAAMAQAIYQSLLEMPEAKRDEWYLPTLAEAALALGDMDKVEAALRRYTDLQATTPAFVLASTLRQFDEVWELDQMDGRGRALVDILRLRLAVAPGGGMELSSDLVAELRGREAPSDDQLQAVLGPGGVATYAWWKAGLESCASVAAVRQKLGPRKGTGFLVRGGDLGLEQAEELVLITNFHVVNEAGRHNGLRPSDAEIVFEAASPPQHFDVAAVLWSSPLSDLDTSVLRLSPAVTGLSPLSIAPELPALPSPPDKVPVYVIGHPAGGDLSVSFRSNDLLDHEGPPSGTPPDAKRLRVHYTATTQRGSSGSPVFNHHRWQVIALHHTGDALRMHMLNGKNGVYGANEGIAMASVVNAAKP